MLSDEEERLSIISSKCGGGGGGGMTTQPIDIITNHHHTNSLGLPHMVSVSRHPSYSRSQVLERNSLGGHDVSSLQQRGSFYGRRDFENKHDDTADIGSVTNSKLCRKPSTLDNVLTRIKSMRNSVHSDDDDEDDDEDEDEDEEYYNDDGIEESQH